MWRNYKCFIDFSPDQPKFNTGPSINDVRPEIFRLYLPLHPLRPCRVCPKCVSSLQQDVTNSHYPLPPNRKNFLLLKTQFATFQWYARISNKQFWQQKLATSKFLVKCHLFTVSFLSNRKRYEYETRRKSDSLTRKFIKNHHMVVTSLTPFFATKMFSILFFFFCRSHLTN